MDPDKHPKNGTPMNVLVDTSVWIESECQSRTRDKAPTREAKREGLLYQHR